MYSNSSPTHDRWTQKYIYKSHYKEAQIYDLILRSLLKKKLLEATSDKLPYDSKEFTSIVLCQLLILNVKQMQLSRTFLPRS